MSQRQRLSRASTPSTLEHLLCSSPGPTLPTRPPPTTDRGRAGRLNARNRPQSQTSSTGTLPSLLFALGAALVVIVIVVIVIICASYRRVSICGFKRRWHTYKTRPPLEAHQRTESCPRADGSRPLARAYPWACSSWLAAAGARACSAWRQMWGGSPSARPWT